jgi:hypothetical protein
MTYNEIEAAIESPKKENLGPDGFSVEFYQTFKENVMPTVLKLFHETEREGMLPNSFYEAIITLISKPDKEIHTKRRERITGQSL